MDRGVNFFGGLASIVSIAIAAVALFFKGDTKDVVQAILAAVALAGFAAAYWRFQKYARRRTSQIPKASLVKVACDHILSAEKKVILFSNDLSWVHEYADALRDRITKGREVLVIHKKSSAPLVIANAGYLRALGARVVELEEDHCLRATLIDPDEQDTALLFVATKKRQPGSAAPLQLGESGNDKDFVYECGVYQSGADKVVIRAITRLASHGYPAKIAA